MTLGELLNAVDDIRELHADPAMEIGGVSYDSRHTAPGDLFVALRGALADGHDFIPAALNAGASCVLCEEAPGVDIPYVLCDRGRRALAAVSAAWFGYPGRELRIIGVTGTNGKTTATTLLKAILEHSTGEKTGLIGTNRILMGETALPAQRTTPESYELQRLFRDMVDAGCRWAVMEVSSHALALDRVWGVPFEVGVFTNLTEDHLDFHGTMEAYGEAKALLFAQCRKSVLNLDDPAAPVMAAACREKPYYYSAKDTAADLTAVDINLKSEGVTFCALTLGHLAKVRLPIPGRFSVYNALAAIAAAECAGIPIPSAAEALRSCGGVKGRVEVVPTQGDYTVLIDYAHTPDALEKIIATLRDFTQGRVITLFGCGGDRDKTKRPIMGEIALRLSDHVVVTTDNPRTEKPADIIADILAGMNGAGKRLTVIEDRREAIAWALKHARAGDTVLLAGKGHETYQTVGTENLPFDERQVVAQLLAAGGRGGDK